MAKKAEAYLRRSGIADTAYFGPEAEFYIFDSIRHEHRHQRGLLPHRPVKGLPGTPARDRENGGNLGYKTRAKGGYFPV